MFPDFLLHLWASPPVDLPLSCPAPPPGQPPDPAGFFDPTTVRAAFDMTAYVSVVAVVILVLLCYLWTRTSLGPKFTRKWWLYVGATALVTFLIPIVLLNLAPVTALAGSCETNPEPFSAVLPWGIILGRAVAGFVWGWLAFIALSLVLTRTVGLVPAGGGFFHNRGMPWPRMFPSRED